MASSRRNEALFAGAVLVTAAGVALAVVRPFSTGPIGFDSAASVAFFQHIASGQRLEAYVGATPKPLLTGVYGVLYAVFGDWRAISWATIGAFAGSVFLAALLARRAAGLGAAAFVTVGLIALPLLESDLILAYATPWAMLGWFSAGVLATGPRPRYGWAGLALMLATLARLETVVLVGTLLAGLAGLWLLRLVGGERLASRVGGLHAPPRRAWLLGIGLLALPVMLLHDWLLTGDPFFWSYVSHVYSLAYPATVRTFVQLRRVLEARYIHQPLLSALAVVGGLFVLQRRQIALALGLLGLGPGVAALLLLLASRDTYVSTRYFAAIDVAVVTTAALGVGAILTLLMSRLTIRPFGPAGRAAAAIGLGVIAAIAAQPHPAPLSAVIQQAASAQLTIDEDADAALPTLRAALDQIPGARQGPPAGVDWDHGTLPPAVLLVPGLARPRLAVDLQLPLSNLTSLVPAAAVPGPAFLGCADLVFHDRSNDLPIDGYGILEIEAPVNVGGDVLLTPLVAQPAGGYWLISVQRSGAAAAACAPPAGSVP